MDNIVLSTAAFCLWDIEAEAKLNICNDLGFQRVQIALSTERMVWNLVRHLESAAEPFPFKGVSLHAPWCGVRYGVNQRTRRILNGLRRIAELLSVDSVIFRVNCIRELESLTQSGLPLCIENSDRDLGLRVFLRVAEETELPLAFNLNRAIRAEVDTAAFLNHYGHRISRLLISGFDRENGRMPLVYTGQTHLLSCARHLSVPVVLEGLFAPGDTESIRRERHTVWLAMGALAQQTA